MFLFNPIFAIRPKLTIKRIYKRSGCRFYITALLPDKLVLAFSQNGLFLFEIFQIFPRCMFRGRRSKLRLSLIPNGPSLAKSSARSLNFERATQGKPWPSWV